MSVLIKGMNMPENCRECKIKTWEERYNVYECPFGGILELSCLANGRRNECPLVELPEKHGKLIDGIELINYCKDMINLNHTPGYNRDASIEERVYTNIIGHIINMPTVIEAEGEE